MGPFRPLRQGAAGISADAVALTKTAGLPYKPGELPFWAY